MPGLQGNVVGTWAQGTIKPHKPIHKSQTSVMTLTLGYHKPALTVTGKQLALVGSKLTLLNGTDSVAYLMASDSNPSTSPLTTN